MNSVEINKIELVPLSFKVVDNVKIGYRDDQSNYIPVFCIPPWPSCSAVYAPLTVALSGEYRVIAIDPPGWGSSQPFTQEITLKHYGEIVADFINSFNFKNYSVIGYSFGGTIVQQMLNSKLIHPDCVVYISTLHSGNEVWDKISKEVEIYRLASKIPRSDLVIKRLFEFIMEVRHKHKSANFYPAFAESQIYQLIFAESVHADMRSLFEIWSDIAKVELLSPGLRDTKSQVIIANEDPTFIKSETYELANYLGIKPTVLENVDHDHLVFKVEPAAKAIELFLNRMYKDDLLSKAKRLFSKNF